MPSYQTPLFNHNGMKLVINYTKKTEIFTNLVIKQHATEKPMDKRGEIKTETA